MSLSFKNWFVLSSLVSGLLSVGCGRDSSFNTHSMFLTAGDGNAAGAVTSTATASATSTFGSDSTAGDLPGSDGSGTHTATGTGTNTGTTSQATTSTATSTAKTVATTYTQDSDPCCTAKIPKTNVQDSDACCGKPPVPKTNVQDSDKCCGVNADPQPPRHDDGPDIAKCLAQWPNHPFQGSVVHYNKIYAAVAVGGYGNIIDDQKATSAPSLTVIDAGVNVFGHPVYNLQNPNGYYCIIANVNVLADLTVNIACNAHLAGAHVTVDVDSHQNQNPAIVGVSVLSSVDVNRTSADGNRCSN